MVNVNGIPLESGINDCYWVCNRKCTNPKVTRNNIPKSFSRDWDSKQNCTYTIIGTSICSGFKFIYERQISGVYKFIRVRRKGREDLRQVIKTVISNECNDMGEDRVDWIEANILEALGMEPRKGNAQ